MAKRIIFGLISVVLGIVAMAFMMFLHRLTTFVYPLPDGVDFMNQEPENLNRRMNGSAHCRPAHFCLQQPVTGSAVRRCDRADVCFRTSFAGAGFRHWSLLHRLRDHEPFVHSSPVLVSIRRHSRLHHPRHDPRNTSEAKGRRRFRIDGRLHEHSAVGWKFAGWSASPSVRQS